MNPLASWAVIVGVLAVVAAVTCAIALGFSLVSDWLAGRRYS